MVDVVRVTQQYVEVVTSDGGSPPTVRVTQQYVEVVTTGGTASGGLFPFTPPMRGGFRRLTGNMET